MGSVLRSLMDQPTPPAPRFGSCHCHGKQPLTQTRAFAIAKRSTHPGIGAYRCIVCWHWHVGSGGTTRSRLKKSDLNKMN